MCLNISKVHTRIFSKTKKSGKMLIMRLVANLPIGKHSNNNNNNNNVTYFDSFEVEYIPKEIKKFIGNKNIITNIYRMQAYDSKMCGYFCIGFIDFMFNGKSVLEYTNLAKEWQNNIKIFLIESK